MRRKSGAFQKRSVNKQEETPETKMLFSKSHFQPMSEVRSATSLSQIRFKEKKGGIRQGREERTE